MFNRFILHQGIILLVGIVLLVFNVSFGFLNLRLEKFYLIPCNGFCAFMASIQIGSAIFMIRRWASEQKRYIAEGRKIPE